LTEWRRDDFLNIIIIYDHLHNFSLYSFSLAPNVKSQDCLLDEQRAIAALSRQPLDASWAFMVFPDGVSDAHVAKDVAARRGHQLLAVFSNLLAAVEANPADNLGSTSRWIRRSRVGVVNAMS